DDDNLTASNTANVSVSTVPPPLLNIESVDPDGGQCDQELTLTIYGDNFTPETDVSISDFIEVIDVHFIDSEELEVEIYIHPDAPLGSCPVEVSNPDGSSDVLEAGFEVNLTESLPLLDPIIIAAIVITAGGTITLLLTIRHTRLKKTKLESAPPSPPPAERIVNTGFSSQTQAEEPLDPTMPLAPAQSYYFWFEVGPAVPGSIEVKPEPLMTKFLPSDARLKVVLFAFPGEIEIKEGGDVGEIQIMPDGKVRVVRQVECPDSIPSRSDFLKRRLFFPVRTPSEEGVFHMRCNIYYEQILIRSRLIQVQVASSLEKARSISDVPALQSIIEYTMSKTLNPNYLVRMKPQSLSLMLNENSDGTHSFRLFGEKDYKSDASFNALELKSLIDKARGALRYASWEDEGPWTEGKRYRYIGYFNQDRLKADLIRFAIQGYRFYCGLTEKIAPGIPNVEKLENLTLKPTTLEFVIKDKTEASNYMFPTTMIYDQPLDTSLNLDDYTLCPSFLKALEKKDPLEETKCFNGNCPSRGNKTVVCPSGFWGFRHSIGMPLGSAAETNHEILYTRAPELTLAVFPSFRQWPLHQKALKSLTTGVVWNLADTRAETLQYLKATNPHLVYFYCHGGVKEDIPYIKVGGKTERGITPDNLFSERVWWESPQPLIFINGCHTTALEPKNTLNFVTSFVKTHHAAGVIGTEITIFEQLARAFAEECLHRFLVKGETIGDAVRQTRLKLLKQGNPLGLVYNVYAIASLRLKKIGEAIN
ncbi:MAG: IPT/TIG domain-containing protein, partial [Candidatus Thorarchaeota archaeon]